MRRIIALSLVLAFAALGSCLFLPSALAHPVPRRAHDRTIEVRISPGQNVNELNIDVRYRLEVDEFTVVFDDLPAIASKEDLRTFEKPNQFFEAFLKLYGPILAANCDATLDGAPLKFAVRSSTYTLRDEKGVPLDHLRSDFVFQAKALLRDGSGSHRLVFRETNYELEEGKVRISLVTDSRVQVSSKAVPDSALMERPPAELLPGDDAKLRRADVTFEVKHGTLPGPEPDQGNLNPVTENTKAPEPDGGSHLISLLLNTNQGIAVLLLMAAAFGAAHALTPGHGKTLVAAYLVGERGTPWHAVVLGLATTISHTGIVILLAAVLLMLFPGAVPQYIQTALGFVGGLMITAMGLWLLLRRLGGGADHIHIGGGHHHHHGPETHVDGSVPEKTGWLGVIVLGISGGIVPCWDAIIMLGLAISAQRLWLGLPLLLAFSAGLAAVLVLLGLAVVYLKGFAVSRRGTSVVVRWLPLASAAVVTALGLGLCYDSLHPRALRAGEAEPASLRAPDGN